MAKILVIDDEIGMRQVIAKILAPLGHEIIGTDEGKRSIQMARDSSPDIVLLDIRLADMDAPDILAGLINAKPNAPVIVLSGFGDIEAAVELVKLGAFDYISKPFKVNDLINVTNKALAKSGVRPAPPPRPAVAPVQENAASGAGEARESAGSIQAVKSRGKPAVFMTAAALLAFAGIATWMLFFAAPGDAEFDISYTNPSGICFDRGDMWVADWTAESICKYHLDDNLKVVAAVKTQDIAPTGLAFDGKNIWSSSSLEQKINRHGRGPSLSIEASFNSPGPSPTGLAFDGKNIWSVDFQQGRIYRHRADETFAVEASYDIPAQNPCGLFISGGYAYVADAKTNRIYKLSADSFFLAGVFEVPGFENRKKQIASIAYDGRSVWVCAAGVGKLFRYRLSSLRSVKF